MEKTNYNRHVISGEDTRGSATPAATTPLRNSERVGLSLNDRPTPDVETSISTPSKKPRKTYLDKLKLLQSANLHKPNELRGMVLRPLIFLSFLVIFYAGFSYGSNLVWFNVLNATASLILGKTYKFRASMVGLSYVSPLIGVAIGSAYTGWFGDRFVIAKARRNGGILESEHRLWLFAPSLILIPGGLIL